MDSFDVRLQPVTFSELSDRLEALGIARHDPIEGAYIFQKQGFRMGVGLNLFYPVAYHGDDELVYPPVIEALLAYFMVSVEEWVTAGDHDIEAAE